MMTTTWQGGSSGNWSDSSNWSNGVPSSNNYGDVVINSPDSITITLTGNTSGIASLTLGSDVTFQSSSTTVHTIAANSGLTLSSPETITLNSTNLTFGGLTLGAAGSSSSGTYVFSGGTVTNSGGIHLTSDQELILRGGIAWNAESPITGTGTVRLDGATLNFTGGQFEANLSFSTDTAQNTLITGDQTNSIKSITNFGYGDRIEVGNGKTLHLALNTDGKTYSLEQNQWNVYCNNVTLENGTVFADYQMVGNYFEYTGAAPCFMAGTLLATPEGQIAVEDVTEGTLLRTADGRTMAVRWVGRSTVSRRFGDPMEVLPIRIQAGALGENLPVRDLLVSPGHALFLDGVLVQAGALVNGVSIVREHDVPELFTYYHVELASHELLLAEGAPAESFVDNVERTHFQNWAERTGTENEPAMVELPYPRALSSRQVPQALHARLEERARLFGAAAAA